MEGKEPASGKIVERAFLPTRLSGDLLTQAYDFVVRREERKQSPPDHFSKRSTRAGKRARRIATTGGRNT